MIARAAILALVGLGLASAGCASGGAEPAKTSYSLGRGVVNYDELRRASAQCTADGGTIESKQDGGDPAQLSNYTCVISKGSK